MLGTTYSRKSDKHVFRVVAADTENRWILQDETEFASPVAVAVEDLRRDFTKAADVAAPPVADEDAGWQRLSAEAHLNALTQAVDTDTLQVGDRDKSGHALPAALAAKLRANARRLRGSKLKTPEEVFGAENPDLAREKADAIWQDGAKLAAFELGQLEEIPNEVARLLDRRIKYRNDEWDRINLKDKRRIEPEPVAAGDDDE